MYFFGALMYLFAVGYADGTGSSLSKSDGTVQCEGGPTNILGTGAWDLSFQAGGANSVDDPSSSDKFFKLRWDNPVESISWLQEPANNGTAYPGPQMISRDVTS